MWGSATRRKEKKERKERRKGSRIFLFSKMVSFCKVGLAARIEKGIFFKKTRGMHWRKRLKRRRRRKHKKTSGDFLRIETSADFFYLSEVSIPRGGILWIALGEKNRD